MTKPTSEQIEELRELSKKATPRPWIVRNADDTVFMNTFYITEVGGPDIDLFDIEQDKNHEKIIAFTLLQEPRYADNEKYEENADFIVAAANLAIPLLDEVERLEKELNHETVQLDMARREREAAEREAERLHSLVEDAHTLMIAGKDETKASGLSVEGWLCGYGALKGGQE